MATDDPVITVRFEGEGVPEVLKAAKREVKKRMKAGMADAAKSEVLPAVQRRAPQIVRHALTVKPTVKGPKITTTGPRKFDRITGLLNFGGTVKSVIAPTESSGHQALVIGSGGVIRARVTKPRKYRGKRFIEQGIAVSFSSFEATVLNEVMASFNGIPHSP